MQNSPRPSVPHPPFSYLLTSDPETGRKYLLCRRSPDGEAPSDELGELETAANLGATLVMVPIDVFDQVAYSICPLVEVSGKEFSELVAPVQQFQTWLERRAALDAEFGVEHIGQPSDSRCAPSRRDEPDGTI